MPKKPLPASGKTRTPVKKLTGKSPAKKISPRPARTVFYKKNANGKIVKDTAIIASHQPDPSSIYAEEFKKFKEQHTCLSDLPDFTVDIYTKYRATIKADNGFYNADLPQQTKSQYFQHLISDSKSGSFDPALTLTEFINKLAEYRKPKAVVYAPQTVFIGRFSIPVDEVVRDMYSDFCSALVNQNKSHPTLEAFMIQHCPGKYNELVNKIVDDQFSSRKPEQLDSMIILEQWGLLGDYCLGTVVNNLYLLQMDESVDAEELLNNSILMLGQRLDLYKKNKK
jgi:hypothetical protein